jgi:hypothetical protein
MLDLEALRVLAADYEAAHVPCAAMELHMRLEWYSSKVTESGEEVRG